MSDEVFDTELDFELPDAPELDEAFGRRVLRLARAELPSEAAASLPVRLRQAVVPLLLLSAGGCRAALTVEEIPSAYRALEAKQP